MTGNANEPPLNPPGAGPIHPRWFSPQFWAEMAHQIALDDARNAREKARMVSDG